MQSRVGILLLSAVLFLAVLGMIGSVYAGPLCDSACSLIGYHQAYCNWLGCPLPDFGIPSSLDCPLQACCCKATSYGQTTTATSTATAGPCNQQSCDSSRSYPNYCLVNGNCLPSCGQAGGAAAVCQQNPCTGGLTNVQSYDCNYCCTPNAPTNTATQTGKTCGALGGYDSGSFHSCRQTANCNSGETNLGQTTDCQACCVPTNSSTGTGQDPCNQDGVCWPTTTCDTTAGAVNGFCVSKTYYNQHQSWFKPLGQTTIGSQTVTYSCGPNYCLVANVNDDGCYNTRGYCYSYSDTSTTGCSSQQGQVSQQCQNKGGDTCDSTVATGAQVVDPNTSYGSPTIKCQNTQGGNNGGNGQCTGTTPTCCSGAAQPLCNNGVWLCPANCGGGGGGGGQTCQGLGYQDTCPANTNCQPVTPAAGLNCCNCVAVTATTTVVTATTTTSSTTTTPIPPSSLVISCNQCLINGQCQCSVSPNDCSSGLITAANLQNNPLPNQGYAIIPASYTVNFYPNQTGTVNVTVYCNDPSRPRTNTTVVSVLNQFLICPSDTFVYVQSSCQVNNCNSGYVQAVEGSTLLSQSSFTSNPFNLSFTAPNVGNVNVTAFCNNPYLPVSYANVRVLTPIGPGPGPTTPAPVGGTFVGTGFTCSPIDGSSTRYTCGFTYTNNYYGKPVFVMFTFSSAGVVAQPAQQYVSQAGPGGPAIVSTTFDCNQVDSGNYQVTWKAFSDDSYRTAIAWFRSSDPIPQINC